ncbi:uncharacterized protein LOC111887961 [Lactuca sativa]|uniref:uncharacterized protein LOC111887961 n=1 Tax=Lactuca sativa TaxID=4236 RepID=UPI000CD980D5|nr:uncharacterized protein LOC111887961 [Lactuca sativa]
MPLFHTLKGCIEKRNFQLTNEAEKALQRIKEELHELPTLDIPIPGETLQVYLSTSGEAISSILTVEMEGEQKPIYFVSRALQGPELNYPTLERLVLVLIYAVRRLRRYFQAHQIKVLTIYPIKQILLKLETSGRLAKWAIELGEHDINYLPRTSIKGQALADFFLEILDGGDPTKEKMWAVEGAPADNTSNNEAEYETLLAGLRLAKQMGVKAITALTNSRLAANQVNGSFEVRDQRMGKYVNMVKQLVGLFERFTIKQIPRSENKSADALSKLASTCFGHLSKKVLVEVLREISINEQQVNALAPPGPTWMTPFREYLQRGVLPDDHGEARKIRIKAPSYAMVNGELYKKGFTAPWIKCVDQAKGKEMLQEAHSSQVSAHEVARALTGKVLRMGVYWPTIQQDAIEMTRKCGECQYYAPVQANPRYRCIAYPAHGHSTSGA